MICVEFVQCLQNTKCTYRRETWNIAAKEYKQWSCYLFPEMLYWREEPECIEAVVCCIKCAMPVYIYIYVSIYLMLTPHHLCLVLIMFSNQLKRRCFFENAFEKGRVPHLLRKTFILQTVCKTGQLLEVKPNHLDCPLLAYCQTKKSKICVKHWTVMGLTSIWLSVCT